MSKVQEAISRFRAEVYQVFTKSRDAAFEIIDGIASSPDARSAVEVSLSGSMKRKWSSIYKGLERTRIETEELSRVLIRTAEEAGKLVIAGYVIYSLDHTDYPRKSAPTVKDRGMVHGANGQGVGHQYSLLGRVMYEAGAWVGVTCCERIPTTQTPTEVGAAQVTWLKANQTLPSIVTADCDYLTKTMLDTIDPQDKRLCLLVRMKGNRVLYRAPEPPKKGQRGRPKSHGQRLKLNDPKTLGKADEVLTVLAEDGSWIEIAIWKNVHVRSHPKLHGSAIRVTAFRPDGQPKFKRPIWLFWTGSPDMDWATFWRVYLKRFCIESVHQFSKNSLAWTRARLGHTPREETWSWLVMLAYWQLLLAAPIAQDAHRPWQKPMPKGRYPTPARVQRDYLRIFSLVGTPAQPPKPRGIPSGRKLGFRPAPRNRHPVVIKSRSSA